MTDERDLLAAVLERPAEDAPRLAYADWLDERAEAVACPKCEKKPHEVNHPPGMMFVGWGHGWQPCPDCSGSGSVPDGRAERAEFVRVQCALARMPHCGETTESGIAGGVRAGCPWCEQATRAWRLYLLNCRNWFPNPSGREWRWHCSVWDGRFAGSGWLMRRGFVAEARLTLADWTRHAPALLAAHPLERVEVADAPGLVWEVQGPLQMWPGSESGWRLVGRLNVPRRGESTGFLWSDQRLYAGRPALVACATAAVAEITERLRNAAGDRWPGSPAEFRTRTARGGLTRG